MTLNFGLKFTTLVSAKDKLTQCVGPGTARVYGCYNTSAGYPGNRLKLFHNYMYILEIIFKIIFVT